MTAYSLPKQVQQAVTLAKLLLEDAKILGIYLYGSATMATLRPDSDIDLLIITEARMDDGTRTALTKGLRTLSGTVGCIEKRPLEVTVVCRGDIVPWQFPPRCEYMYGEWLREELDAGAIPQADPEPELALLLWQARLHSLTLFGAACETVVPPLSFAQLKEAMAGLLPSLLAGYKGDERNVLLTLARMWFSLETAEMTTKDKAAAWAMPKLPPSLAPLLETARAAYLGETKARWDDKEDAVKTLMAVMKAQIEARL